MADPDPHHESIGRPVWFGRSAAVSSARQYGRFSRHRPVARAGDVREFFCPAASRGICVIKPAREVLFTVVSRRRKIQGKEFHRHRRLARRDASTGMVGIWNQDCSA